MVTWSDIRRWNSAAFQPVLEALAEDRKRVRRAHWELECSDTSRDWQGKTADLAAVRRVQLQERCQVLVDAIDDLIAATSKAQSGTYAVELAVIEACSIADQYGFKILGSGQVTDASDGRAQPTEDPEDFPKHLAELTARLNALERTQKVVELALQKAERVDRMYSEALGNAAQGSI
ncbi:MULTISPECIES: hypothetical protein [unclassified Actinobaculum]|uniref:hypothetical protein n=1 Tax=unclassified Actinobaculum TaxID=2609299 RepID=UPI000D52A267|nr:MULTISPECIES: hypothetical protein [unclassified Actinobaculum]AWE42057.1 hypothetical protein DDD63_03965 [Actinobaculum sp. 313]RTE50606.1 hypothetical protein EKN07_00130 [Actinobaculum sp. 352]